jgi:hypothetical protein
LLFSHRYDAGAAVDGVRLGGGEEGDRFSWVVKNEVFVVLIVVFGTGLCDWVVLSQKFGYDLVDCFLRAMSVGVNHLQRIAVSVIDAFDL